ncbi:MAG TPA: hypothetical protein VHT50_14980 [Mycobacterium sp.]|jgi:hypothetical protein|nr:hypothetical protein [Mycobacterium sp.]
MVESSEWTAIQQVVDRLTQSYPSMPPDTVTTVVHHNHARFDGRPVRDFVPLFVERGARQELAQLDGSSPAAVKLAAQVAPSETF